jgi:hypothetical protein
MQRDERAIVRIGFVGEVVSGSRIAKRKKASARLWTTLERGSKDFSIVAYRWKSSMISQIW